MLPSSQAHWLSVLPCNDARTWSCYCLESVTDMSSTEENVRSSKLQKDAITMFCNASVSFAESIVWLGQDLRQLEHGLACCDLSQEVTSSRFCVNVKTPCQLEHAASSNSNWCKGYLHPQCMCCCSRQRRNTSTADKGNGQLRPSTTCRSCTSHGVTTAAAAACRACQSHAGA